MVGHNKNASKVTCQKDEIAEYVIDLGAPTQLNVKTTPRLPRIYTPNPRLYRTSTSENKSKRQKSRQTERRTRRRSRKFIPNARLYRPPPVRPPPAPRRPRAAWPQPARALDTASHAALRVLHARRLSPQRAAGDAARTWRRGQQARPPPRDPPPARPPTGSMAAGKYSTSPDCSDGNEASSAPSEFLAEFLSAIMRRQYAEALKYCQLILQYEPHNSTARGFYPLLQHKLHALQAAHAGETSSSDETGSRRGGFNARFRQESRAETEGEGDGEGEAEEMEQGSGSACSSLELDSSASSSPRPAARAPRSPDTTDPSDSASWRWESGGERSERSERDDNGNPAQLGGDARSASETEGAADAAPEDVENDNALLAAHAKRAARGGGRRGGAASSPAALRRLRASFACSIK
ncbi:unnamed protein product [Euphydryas editha]|uniref:Uncharacterized protein n=1 Tax=Euphydryas editha TaxID=104508 RepID=A0AAU9TFQ2_EUPED|nr:unnamed protein product [Euphydryas editha]